MGGMESGSATFLALVLPAATLCPGCRTQLLWNCSRPLEYEHSRLLIFNLRLFHSFNWMNFNIFIVFHLQIYLKLLKINDNNDNIEFWREKPRMIPRLQSFDWDLLLYWCLLFLLNEFQHFYSFSLKNLSKTIENQWKQWNYWIFEGKSLEWFPDFKVSTEIDFYIDVS